MRQHGFLVIALCIRLFSWLAHAQETPRLDHGTEHLSVINKHPDEIIEPGIGFGGLKITDTREKVYKLFPLKPKTDQEWRDECGGMYSWVADSGNVDFSFVDGRLTQIESATTRFHTVNGVTTYDSPEKVRRYYKGLRAYVLLGPTSAALGDRPLVFWVAKDRGIAFEFAYDSKERDRYLYKIIVFKPHTKMCPEGKTTTPENWHELAPYSLELPDQTAKKREPKFAIEHVGMPVSGPQRESSDRPDKSSAIICDS